MDAAGWKAIEEDQRRRERGEPPLPLGQGTIDIDAWEAAGCPEDWERFTVPHPVATPPPPPGRPASVSPVDPEIERQAAEMLRDMKATRFSPPPLPRPSKWEPHMETAWKIVTGVVIAAVLVIALVGSLGALGVVVRAIFD